MEPSFWSWEKPVPDATISPVTYLVAMEPSFWSWEKQPSPTPTAPAKSPSQWSPAFGAGKRRHGVDHRRHADLVAMEPSFWSWEKEPPGAHSALRLRCRNGAQLLELGKVADSPKIDVEYGSVAMEPSFWSWEKPGVAGQAGGPSMRSQWSPAFGAGKRCQSSAPLNSGPSSMRSQWSPAFGAGKSRHAQQKERRLMAMSQWSPAFGAGKSAAGIPAARQSRSVAMEPSFWSWEKLRLGIRVRTKTLSRNGAQLLELGKARACRWTRWARSCRNGAQLLELGKGIVLRPAEAAPSRVAMEPSFWSWEKEPTKARCGCSTPSQWSPAFGAGKRASSRTRFSTVSYCRNGAQLLELGKAADSPATHQGQGSRNGAQLLELGKEGADEWPQCGIHGLSQWSPAFGAGKRGSARDVVVLIDHGRNGAQLLELGKASPRRYAPGAGSVAMEPSFWSWEKNTDMQGAFDLAAVAMEPSFWSWEKPSGLGTTG